MLCIFEFHSKLYVIAMFSENRERRMFVIVESYLLYIYMCDFENKRTLLRGAIVALTLR